jgi:signal transduction histidine kinase
MAVTTKSHLLKEKKPGVVGASRRPVKAFGDDWIYNEIFEETRTIAWEGTARPLVAKSIWPHTHSFVRALPLAINHAWHRCIHPLDREKVRRHFRTIADRALPVYIDYRLIDKNGSIVWVRHATREVIGRGAKVLTRGFVSDIQTEKAYQLESLRVSEREQNRIGQDLHDDLCQVLAGVSCLMRVAEGRITTKIPEEALTFKELNQQIIDAMHRTRALTHGLYPGKIQIADIRGSLLELAEQVKTRFNLKVRVQFKGRFPRHNPEQIIQIYRIAQEAISNAVRHGGATQVDVKLEALADEMELTVRDNGSGLGKADVSAGGVGLHIMNYRATSLGGSVTIANVSGGGVTACLRYPFQN